MRGDRTSALPKTVDGITFHCYNVGALRTIWRSEDRELAAGIWRSGSTYYAIVGLQRFDKRFRSLENAMRFAVKYRKGHSPSAS